MRQAKQQVLKAECPECDTHIRFHSRPKVGKIVVCPECDERLEVRRLNPLELEWADEDYDDDWYDSWGDDY